MSQANYQIKGAVTNGEYISQSIAQYFERHYITVTFYSDEYKTPVRPTAGTVEFTATDDGFNYGSVSNGVVDVTNQEYARPNMSGKFQKVKATTSGITGATHFTAVINSYN